MAATPAVVPASSAGSTALGIMALVQLLAGTAGKLVGGEVGTDISIGTDLLQVANTALALHAQATGEPIDTVIAGLQDLPPLPPVAGT